MKWLLEEGEWKDLSVSVRLVLWEWEWDLDLDLDSGLGSGLEGVEAVLKERELGGKSDKRAMWPKRRGLTAKVTESHTEQGGMQNRESK
jgi:hypothetical protein